MNALIWNNRVCQLSMVAFPVAPPLFWIDVPSNVDVGWTYVDGEFTPPPPDPIEIELTNQIFVIPIHAPDFIVNSPTIPEDKKKALADAILEAKKPLKSIAFIALAIAKYMEDIEDRLSKLEKK